LLGKADIGKDDAMLYRTNSFYLLIIEVIRRVISDIIISEKHIFDINPITLSDFEIINQEPQNIKP